MDKITEFFNSIVDFILNFVNTIKDLVANVSGD